MAYSYNDGSVNRLFLKTLPDRSSVEIFPASLTEKCVWGNKEPVSIYCGSPIDGIGSGEPDRWYKGMTNYSDRIWRIEANTQLSGILVDPKKSLGFDIDSIDLKLSPDENFLFFINRNDYTLWALRLEQI